MLARKVYAEGRQVQILKRPSKLLGTKFLKLI